MPELDRAVLGKEGRGMELHVLDIKLGKLLPEGAAIFGIRGIEALDIGLALKGSVHGFNVHEPEAAQSDGQLDVVKSDPRALEGGNTEEPGLKNGAERRKELNRDRANREGMPKHG